MKEISSLYNPEIKNIVRLHEPKARAEQKLCIIEGERAIITACEKLELKALYINPENIHDAKEICSEKLITVISAEIMAKISTQVTPSGFLGLFRIPSSKPFTDTKSGIVLAHINDPGNMGTLIRTAAACAIDTVIIIDGTDPWGPKAIQATAGTIAFVNIVKLTWPELITYKKDFALYALVVQNGEDIRSVKFTKHLLVIGNESTGIPQSWQTQCEKLITLPMPGKTESLNAAVAGSIALYTATVLYSDTKN